jgi:DNA-binding beta-propeller fold protein YncE
LHTIGEPMAVRVASLAVLVCLALLAPAASAAAASGDLTQLAGPAGCATTDGLAVLGGAPGACATAPALAGAYDVALSPDGRNVYVASAGWQPSDIQDPLGGGLALFSRDPATGALTAAGCVNDKGSDPTGATCQKAAASMQSASQVVVSADGRSVYVLSHTLKAVSDESGPGLRLGSFVIYAFARDTSTGALTPLAGKARCLDRAGKDSLGQCTRLAGEPLELAFGPEGKSAYVGTPSALVRLRRDASGALAPVAGRRGCLSSSAHRRGCSAARGLGASNFRFAIPADGRSLYVATYRDRADGQFGGSGIASFARYDKGIRDKRFLKGCQVVRDTQFVGQISPTSDGKAVLVTGEKLLSFARRSNGTLRLVGASRFRGLLMTTDSTGATVYGGYGAEYGSGSGFGVVNGFTRDPGGAVTAIAPPGGCSTSRIGDLSHSGEIVGAPTSPPCADGRAIIDPRALTLSPDGLNLYVAGGGYQTLPGGVAVFARAP